MDKTTAFWAISAIFVLAFIISPLDKLRTGKIEYKKIYYPNAEPLLRSRDPQRFYLRVTFEMLFLAAMPLVIYWIMFEIKTK